MAGPRARFQRYSYQVGSSSSINTLRGIHLEALLATEGHKMKNGVYQSGGPFYKFERELTCKGGGTFKGSKNGFQVTHQMMGCPGTGPTTQLPIVPQPATYSSIKSSLQGSYATARARTRPGKAIASAGQFLVELRDLPKIPFAPLWKIGNSSNPALHAKTQLGKFLKLGANEYLNQVFGWMPFVRDLREIYRLMKTIDNKMAQLVRDNGKGIRRGCTLETTNSREVLADTTYAYPFANVNGAAPNWPSGSTRYQLVRTTQRKVWFVAKYRYFIPDTSSWQWNLQARLALFGALPTPELLWEVLPWSWMIDWFTNMGDVVSNMSTNAVNNLVTEYSYIMKQETVSKIATADTQWVFRKIPPDSWDGGGFHTESRDITITKFRGGGGNPFGLDVSFSGLSPYQQGVVAALGISRSKFL